MWLHAQRIRPVAVASTGSTRRPVSSDRNRIAACTPYAEAATPMTLRQRRR